MASACHDGGPDHGNFAALMKEGNSPGEVMASVFAKEPILDQWQAQILAGILERVDVKVYTDMAADQVRNCKLEVIPNLNDAVRDAVMRAGGDARVAVLPDGPLTIPYLKGN